MGSPDSYTRTSDGGWCAVWTLKPRRHWRLSPYTRRL